MSERLFVLEVSVALTPYNVQSHRLFFESEERARKTFDEVRDLLDRRERYDSDLPATIELAHDFGRGVLQVSQIQSAGFTDCTAYWRANDQQAKMRRDATQDIFEPATPEMGVIAELEK